MLSVNARTALKYSLSLGQAHDDPAGRALLQSIVKPLQPLPLLMYKAYEGDKIRELAVEKGFLPVVPPRSNRKNPWQYDKEQYKSRNEIERLFRRLKGYRRVFSRFDKLDFMFLGFIQFVLIIEALRLC